jgi:DNA mismatch repair protein MutS
MQDVTTPMMKQYLEIKKQYKDCLLLYRMGDFYELFMEDAYIGAKILNITLTGKSNGKNDRIPMAGVPYHAVDTYLTKLVKSGYKVAICEQLSPPNKKGLVERDVVRVVTPGTLVDEKALEKKENNYIISLLIQDTAFAMSVADLSTGYFATTQIETDDFGKTIRDELAKLQPSECILPDELYNDPMLLKILKQQQKLNIYPFSNWITYSHEGLNVLKRHFGVITLESFGVHQNSLSIQTAAALLGYLKETQKGTISHIKKLTSLSHEEGLILDRATIINLELFSTIREHDTRGSLLSIMDETITAMGGRLLKQWMKKPLIEKDAIEQRLEAVQVFLDTSVLRDQIRELFAQIPDIERLLSRLSVNLGNARDLVNLKLALQTILAARTLFDDIDNNLVKQQRKAIAKDLRSIVSYLFDMIVEEPPITVREGRMIKRGVDKQLDTLRETVEKSKEWITELEKKEREKTGISSLKVRFNKVFGFYIEVSKTNVDKVPKHYSRKQTLVNGERFITDELKYHEEIILTAEDKINTIEYEIFLKVLAYVLSHTQDIQNAAQSIAVIDCITTFSYISEKNRYNKPKILYSGEMRIKQGRHPVVEKLLQDLPFVPNDIALDNITQQLLVITGPNMAGKSVFIRQVALIVLMSQMGCFVPAASAHISIVDKIFVRSGASDVITSGLSTFMVEMVETAYILNNATKNSLIIMDEIGRGTSTYDGISIAWAVAQYLVTTFKPSPKTLFATHYHELQSLEEKYPKYIKNYHMAVTEEKGEPVFLHTILPGGASHSFGVAVAKLAGVPQAVIDSAYEILQTLEYRDVEKGKAYFQEKETVEVSTVGKQILEKEVANLDLSNMTPLEALNKLAELKDKLKLLQTKSEEFLEAD